MNAENCQMNRLRRGSVNKNTTAANALDQMHFHSFEKLHCHPKKKQQRNNSRKKFAFLAILLFRA